MKKRSKQEGKAQGSSLSENQEYIPKAKPRGRPPKYCVEYGDKAIELMEEGKSIVAVCKELRISRDTFYRWCKEHEEFKDRIQEGLTYSEAWWEELGLHGMLGKIDKFNPTMYIHRVNSQFKWQSEKSPGNSINIENLQINNLSDGDLDKKIASLQSQMKLLDNIDVDESD